MSDLLRAEADRVAIEQCLWWAAAGETPGEALRALGLAWTSPRDPDWYDVQLAAALMWRRLIDRPVQAAPPRATAEGTIVQGTTVLRLVAASQGG